MRLTDIAKTFLSEVLNEGDKAVDATAGNGYDTHFLAERVGAKGHVYAFDIQAPAIAATERRLAAAGLLSRVTLIQDSHDNLDAYVDHDVNVAMFNLGFLPGSDKQTTTSFATTGRALTKLLTRLAHLGRLTVMAYRGHDGGESETQAVANLIHALDARFVVTEKKAPANGPVLFMIEKIN
ncbi:MAG: class I SAM-dependent methyltransferase [Pseudomonadota bacterium]